MEAAQAALAVAEEQIDAMFLPEQTLPEQWYRAYRNEELSPIGKLCRAVFHDAMTVLSRYSDVDDPQARTLVHEALEWIRDVDGRAHSYRFTFRVTVELGLPECDADALSEKILRTYRLFRGQRLVKMRLVQRNRGPRIAVGDE